MAHKPLGKCFTDDNIALDVVFKLNFAFPFNINTLFEASFNLKAILYNLKINKTLLEFKTCSSQKRGNVRHIAWLQQIIFKSVCT